ncbi:hypothetical protein QBC38DRAFT_26620 [Podospora fimiseda]|uniref:Uncharacterized protein n=1 Tax=Podospora fimiseda TaxID=252190 RepID=A0AAN7BIV5_9PEZI|nr:hypothetical protein QBC38DRAFT_26620 [Podospora fimiseda]
MGTPYGLFERKSFVIFAPVAYGCAHLCAWNGPFPTYVEQMAWILSCISIASAGISLVWVHIANFNWARRHGMFEYPEKLLGQELEHAPGCVRRTLALYNSALCKNFPVMIILPIVILCRLYLVVESFASLRAVPIGVYWVPGWTKMILHVGG